VLPGCGSGSEPNLNRTWIQVRGARKICGAARDSRILDFGEPVQTGLNRFEPHVFSV
jgi:hypothetical protein